MHRYSLMRIVRTCADTLFPPSPDMLLVRDAGAYTLAQRIAVKTISETETLLSFRDPLVRACVHEAKFHHNKKAIALLGNALREYLRTSAQKSCTIIPIPLSRARMRDRGHNQVTSIARHVLFEDADIDICEKILVRTRHTHPQTDLPKDKRVENVAGAFGVHEKNVSTLRGADIILLDDVITTGATMNAAKAQLLPHSPGSIICIALAH